MDTYNLSFPDVAIDAILATAYELQNAGYIFRGVASELYGTPTKRSWVLAGEGETGHGFTSPVPKGYIGVCVFDGTSWTGKQLKCVSIDSAPTNGSESAVSSGGTYASINQLATMVNEALDNLTFTDSTPSAFLGEYITEKVSTNNGGIERILTYFTILAATAEKAGLLSAADKQKIDSFLGIVRSLEIDDTTAYADLGDKIVESIKATIGGQEETISTFQLLAATAEKAGLLSAADKQKVDAFLDNLRSLEIDDTTAAADLGTKIVESIKATIGGQEETISTFQILSATASKAGLLSAADKAKLDAMWSSGYQFAGIATPSTTPVSTTSKIFYFATEEGIYTDFDSLVLSRGLNILRYNGSAWSSMQLFGIDGEPVAGSKSVVESGGVDKHIHSVLQKVGNMSVMTPVQVIDGKFMNTDGTLTDNHNFKCLKFAVEPYNTYFYSGRFDSDVATCFVVVCDEVGTVIMKAGYHNHENVIARDELFYTNNADAAYVYLNVYEKFSTSFCLAGYTVLDNIGYDNMLSIKSKMVVAESVLHKFYRASLPGYVANIAFSCFKFEVDENKKYAVSCMLSAGFYGNKVHFVGHNGENLGGACAGDASSPVLYKDEIVTTPSGCEYVYFDVEIANIEYAAFEVIEVGKPITEKVIMSSKTDSAYWSTSQGEKSNVLLAIMKFAVTPGRTYLTRSRGMMTATDAYQAVWIDGEGHTISAFGKRLDGEIHEFVGTAPSNAAYLYLNVYKSYEYMSGVELCDTDRTSDILGELNRTGYCRLDAGVFFVNALDMPEDAMIEGCGNSTIVVLAGTSDGYAIRLSRNNAVSNIRLIGATEDIVISEPSDINTISIGNRHGIVLIGNATDNISFDEKWAGNVIDGCSFRNFSGGAITSQQTGYSMKDSLRVANCHIYNCGAGINISFFSEFNRFTGNQIHHCTYAIINQGGNNTFVNCDLSECAIGMYANGNSDKCLLYDGSYATGINMLHGLMDGCTVNHMGIGDNANNGYSIVFLNAGTAGFIFTSMQIWYGKIRIIDSTRIQFCNIRLGRNSHIDTVSNLLVIFNEVFFGAPSSYPVISVYTDNTMTDIDRNYLTDGNLQRVKLINSYLDNGNLVSISDFAPVLQN